MISLGLSSADQKKFETSLFTRYDLRITVQILDLNHRYISDVSEMLIDGQVNYSYWEPISYSASMTLRDPDYLLGFDTASPSDNALYADRMIRIVYSVYSELLPRWVDIPIFCGPVTKVKRDDAVLSVECQGKESLVVLPTMAWDTKTYRKGERLTAVIYNMMRLRAGETKFDLPEWSATLGHDYSYWSETEIWGFVNGLCGTRHIRQLFYDGRGVLRLRERPLRPVLTITSDMLLSVPKLDYNHADIRNAVGVRGATPEGKTKPLFAIRYVTPPSESSSAQSLGRNGYLRVIAEIAEDPTLTTQSAVNAAADKLLYNVRYADVGFELSTPPLPHLEPGDVFTLSTEGISVNLRNNEGSIPLRAGEQSIGTIRKLSVNRARIRR